MLKAEKETLSHCLTFLPYQDSGGGVTESPLPAWPHVPAPRRSSGFFLGARMVLQRSVWRRGSDGETPGVLG